MTAPLSANQFSNKIDLLILFGIIIISIGNYFYIALKKGVVWMAENKEGTMQFKISVDNNTKVQEILKEVYAALKEKGYNPINQLVGYILSGDPTYITSHKNARALIRKIERDELLEELLKSYLEK